VVEQQEGAGARAGTEGEREAPPEPRSDEPFDADPPVDPSEPQVGNSRARFFVPREDAGEDEDGESTESEEAESEGREEG
jgi:hypothetical protein